MGDDDDKKIIKDIYVSLMTTWNAESARHWSRHNIFLVLNSGMIAIVISQNIKPSILRIMATVFGFVLSLLWVMVNIQGRFWQYRFYQKLGELERKLQLDIKVFQYEPFQKMDWLMWYSRKFSIIRCSIYFSFLFVIAWLCLLLYYLFD